VCDYCNSEKVLLSTTFTYDYDSGSSYDRENEGLEVFIEQGYLRLVDTVARDNLLLGEKIKIKYCPMCSRCLG
jgi:hypothetical protein